MAGTLDFTTETAFCPDCGESVEILICEDYHPKLGMERGIAGGEHSCENCGHLIHDTDLEDWMFE